MLKNFHPARGARLPQWGRFTAVVTLSPGSLLHRVRVPGAKRLAAWSYAICLSHKPLAATLQRTLDARGIEADSAAAVVAGILLCPVGSGLLHRRVETPRTNLRDRIVPSALPTLSARTAGLSFPRSPT